MILRPSSGMKGIRRMMMTTAPMVKNQAPWLVFHLPVRRRTSRDLENPIKRTRRARWTEDMSMMGIVNSVDHGMGL